MYSYSTCLSVHQARSHVHCTDALPASQYTRCRESCTATLPVSQHTRRGVMYIVQLLYLPLSTPGEESCTATLPASQYTRRGVMYIVQMLYLPLSTPGAGSHVQLLYLFLSTPGEESCTLYSYSTCLSVHQVRSHLHFVQLLYLYQNRIYFNPLVSGLGRFE